jgi:hypothetical protein
VIYPTLTAANKRTQQYEETNGLILRKQSNSSDSLTRPELSQKIRPGDVSVQTEPISYSKLWHMVIDKWRIEGRKVVEGKGSPCLSLLISLWHTAHGFPKFHRIVTGDSTENSARPLLPNQQKTGQSVGRLSISLDWTQ